MHELTYKELLELYRSTYRSKDGDFLLYRRNAGEETDNENPNVFSAYFYYLFLQTDTFIEEVADLMQFEDRIKSRDGDLILSRTSESFGHKNASHDEHQGLFAFACLYQTGRIIKYMYEFQKSGDSEKPTSTLTFLTMWRQPHVVSLLKKALGIKLNPLDYLFITGAAFTTLFKDLYDTDGKMMAWLRFEALCNDPDEVYLNTIYKIWWNILQSRYKELCYTDNKKHALHWLFSFYFKEHNHPINELARRWEPWSLQD